MTDVKVMSVTFLLPAGRSRARDRFSHGSDVPHDYVSQTCQSTFLKLRGLENMKFRQNGDPLMQVFYQLDNTLRKNHVTVTK